MMWDSFRKLAVMLAGCFDAIECPRQLGHHEDSIANFNKYSALNTTHTIIHSKQQLTMNNLAKNLPQLRAVTRDLATQW